MLASSSSGVRVAEYTYKPSPVKPGTKSGFSAFSHCATSGLMSSDLLDQSAITHTRGWVLAALKIVFLLRKGTVCATSSGAYSVTS